MRLPILQHLSRFFFWVWGWGQSITSPFYSPDLSPCNFWLSPKLKSLLEREEICECDGHTVHKLSQWRLTANWLAPQESDCSQMCSKVSSDWLPSYIKAMQPVLEICKMDKYFLNSPCISIASHIYKIGKLQSLLQCTNFPHTFFVTWPCWFYFKCIYILYCLALFTVVPFMTAVTRICIFIAPSMFPAFL